MLLCVCVVIIVAESLLKGLKHLGLSENTAGTRTDKYATLYASVNRQFI